MATTDPTAGSTDISSLVTSILQSAQAGQTPGSGAFDDSTLSALFNTSAALNNIPIDLGLSGKYQRVEGTSPYTYTGQVQSADVMSYAKAISSIYDMPSDQLSTVQRQMWDANMFTPAAYGRGYTPGAITAGDDTEDAWKTVVETAAKQKKSVAQVLQEQTALVNKQGGITSVQKKLQGKQRYAVTGGAEIATTANKVAQSLIGRDLTPDEINKIIGEQQAAENAAGETISGGVVSTSPEATASQFIQGQDQTEVQAQRMLNAFQIIQQRIGSASNPVSASALKGAVQ